MIGIVLALALTQSPAECAAMCPEGAERGRCCSECEYWVEQRDHASPRTAEYRAQLDKCLAEEQARTTTIARAPKCDAACAGGTGPCCQECTVASLACARGDAERCGDGLAEYEKCSAEATSAAAKWAIPATTDAASRQRVLQSVRRCYFTQVRTASRGAIKDEQDAGKIAGFVNKVKLYKLQTRAHEADKGLAAGDAAFRKLNVKPYACEIGWVDHLVQCMHERDKVYSGCVDAPWSSVKDDLR